MKNPFLVFEGILSPLQCEEIIVANNMSFPNYDKYNKVQPLFFRNRLAETRIVSVMETEVLPVIEKHYETTVRGVKEFQFEWYSEGYEGKNPPRCENSVFLNGKWMRSNSNDFAAIIFFNDYNDQIPFDSDFEVFGGQLEFVNHGFSFNPQRGTMIVFPGAPNFINNTAAIKAGELTQVRIHVATEGIFVYDMDKFKGNFNNWFK